MYAEAEYLQFFVAAVGGCIGLEPPDGEDEERGTRYYGLGPLRIKVELYYMSGKEPTALQASPVVD